MGAGLGVGLFMNDHRQIIPAMLGVLKSRDYFVPLDVSFPEETLKYIFDVARIKIILTVKQFAGQVRSMVGEELTILSLDDLDFAQVIPDPDVSYSLEDIVQILFTSGSTGQPKGAIEDYRYLTRFSFVKYIGQELRPDERVLQLSTFTYSGPHSLIFSAIIEWVDDLLL